MQLVFFVVMLVSLLFKSFGIQPDDIKKAQPLVPVDLIAQKEDPKADENALPELSDEQIGENVERAYNTPEYMEVSGPITQEPSPGYPREKDGDYGTIQVKSIMAKGAFNTKVRDEQSDIVLAFALWSGRLQEFSAEESKAVIHKNPAPLTNGTISPTVSSRYLCWVGSRTYSWVGTTDENSLSEAEYMRKIVDMGKRDRALEKIERAKGQPAYVIRWVINKDVEHIAVIDPKTFLYRRWATRQFGILRTRHMEITTGTKVPPGTNWELNLEELLKAK